MKKYYNVIKNGKKDLLLECNPETLTKKVICRSPEIKVLYEPSQALIYSMVENDDAPALVLHIDGQKPLKIENVAESFLNLPYLVYRQEAEWFAYHLDSGETQSLGSWYWKGIFCQKLGELFQLHAFIYVEKDNYRLVSLKNFKNILHNPAAQTVYCKRDMFVCIRQDETAEIYESDTQKNGIVRQITGCLVCVSEEWWIYNQNKSAYEKMQCEYRYYSCERIWKNAVYIKPYRQEREISCLYIFDSNGQYQKIEFTYQDLTVEKEFIRIGDKKWSVDSNYQVNPVFELIPPEPAPETSEKPQSWIKKIFG